VYRSILTRQSLAACLYMNAQPACNSTRMPAFTSSIR
jgi:hypothetical protein